MKKNVKYIIQLDNENDIKKLYQLTQNNKYQNSAINNIKCRYKDFTFNVNLNDVDIPLITTGEEIKIIIKKPKTYASTEQNAMLVKKMIITQYNY